MACGVISSITLFAAILIGFIVSSHYKKFKYIPTISISAAEPHARPYVEFFSNIAIISSILAIIIIYIFTCVILLS
ncbi:hypothetical protein MXB_2790 [Myxobolus squamalis]|nr:hypothetical protein MXB_2790 [Myxobolus squamalis]